MRLLLTLAVMLVSACGPKPPEFKVGFSNVDGPANMAGVSVVDLSNLKKRRVDHLSLALEIRFMSYDAVLNGASGVWYNASSMTNVPSLAPGPDLFSAASSTAQELRAMAPVFARGRAIPLPFEAPTEGWMARAWTYRGRDYLVLANRTIDRQWRVPEAALEPGWRPLFEASATPRASHE